MQDLEEQPVLTALLTVVASSMNVVMALISLGIFVSLHIVFPSTTHLRNDVEAGLFRPFCRNTKAGRLDLVRVFADGHLRLVNHDVRESLA
jgi:hypothetical protein